MKFNFDKKYLFWGLTSLCVLLLSIFFCFILFNTSRLFEIFQKAIDICSPIIAGLVIAFLLTPMVNWLERRGFAIFYKKKCTYNELQPKTKKIMRLCSILISFIIVLALLFAFFYAIIPQITESVKNISAQSMLYKRNVERWYVEISVKNPTFANALKDMYEQLSVQIEQFKDQSLIPKIEELLTKVSIGVFSFLRFIWDVIIGSLISVYVLFNKEKFTGQFKKLCYGFVGIRFGNVVIKNMRMINDKFSGFIIGKILDSIIMGILIFIGCTIFRFDYPVLIALIIGVTNIVPFFGPIFGAIPCIFLLLMINPIKALYFFIFILAMQQFDGNILGPKILGVSTGISSFWVIFSITVFGGIWGVPGMIIGTPLFAVIYTILKSLLELKLKKKDLVVDTDQYIDLDCIESTSDGKKNYVSISHNEFETKPSMIKRIFMKNKEKSNKKK